MKEKAFFVLALILALILFVFSPVMAKEIANALAEAYIEYDMSTRIDSSRHAQSWINIQLQEIKKSLKQAEKEFLAYKQREKVLFSMQGKQGDISNKMSEYAAALGQTKDKRIELKGIIKKLEHISFSRSSLSSYQVFCRSKY